VKVITVTAVALVFLATAQTAYALREELFGNTPVRNQPGWAGGVLEIVNLDSRVYAQFHDGTVSCFYKGDVRALNEALRKYAAVKADERRVIVLPGPGKPVFSSKPIDGDWQFYVPGGNSRGIPKSKHPLFTVYVSAEKSRGFLDRQKAEKWVAELDADSFEIREAATRELERLGALVKPLLRESLKTSPTPEVRRRIDGLLSKLQGFDADDLDIPDRLTVITAGGLLEAYLKDLTGADRVKSGLAVSGLVELAPNCDQVVPAVAALLQNGQSNSVRQDAARCLGWVGAAAKAVLPALNAGLSDADLNVRNAFQTAIQQIEKAKAEPRSEAEVRKRLAILKDLEELKAARKK
jgi:hypothetical protein